jgi:ATP-dependent RNA/DNA helicase IGHMBP2
MTFTYFDVHQKTQKMDVSAFVARTTELLQLERTAEIAEAQAFQANVSLTVLEARGVALHRLRLVSLATAMYGRSLVVLATKRHGLVTDCPLPATKLSPGSIVDLRRSKPGGGAAETLASGVVTRLAATQITVWRCVFFLSSRFFHFFFPSSTHSLPTRGSELTQ